MARTSYIRWDDDDVKDKFIVGWVIIEPLSIYKF
jgi:hypothetical protein